MASKKRWRYLILIISLVIGALLLAEFGHKRRGSATNRLFNATARMKIRFNMGRKDEVVQEIDVSDKEHLAREYRETLLLLDELSPPGSSAQESSIAPPDLKPSHMITCFDSSNNFIYAFLFDGTLTFCVVDKFDHSLRKDDTRVLKTLRDKMMKETSTGH